VNTTYAEAEPKRAELDKLAGPTLVEFGSPWCGYCRAEQPLIAGALAEYPGVRHLKIADASGKRLGRSFGVKLWPTLIFLSDGKEVARLVRPREPGAIREALAQIGRSSSMGSRPSTPAWSATA
jgi:thioredoxin 1